MHVPGEMCNFVNWKQYICIYQFTDKMISSILNSSRTVFTTQYLAMMSDGKSRGAIVAQLNRYVRQGLLQNPRKGIYAKSNYRKEEMACSLFHPSYVSLEYVLQRAGVVFQYDDTITSVSYLSRTVDIDGLAYSFRKIDPQLWGGMDGITFNDNISIATPERAFLDMVYLSAGNCYFDNLRPLNRRLIRQLLPHYQSHKLTERVEHILNQQ